VFNQKSCVIDCTARNLSEGGARLHVASVVGVPEQFELLIDGTVRRVETMWRTEHEIGVAFL